MALPGRQFISIMFRGTHRDRTGDASQHAISDGPVGGVEEATLDELDGIAVDVFASSEPSQENDDAEQAESHGSGDVVSAKEPAQDKYAEQADSPESPEDREASNRPPLESDSLGRTEGEAARDSIESPSPSLSKAPIEYDVNTEDQLTTETQGLPEDLPNSPDNSPREDSPPPISVQDRLSETLQSIFHKKKAKDPFLQALLDLHGEVDLSQLAAELGEFAKNIGASKDRN